MFFTLLKKYKIGGKFLKILQNIYRDNTMVVNLDNGITKPFNTTIGCKQGCVFSPLVFNIFIDSLPSVFDSECDPVYVGNTMTSCLMWADDCVVLSETERGLQRAMDKTVEHFTSLGLTVNISKTKVLIFNPQGHGPSKYLNTNFYCKGKVVEKCDSFKYLGLIFIPSGSVIPAIKELLT